MAHSILALTDLSQASTLVLAHAARFASAVDGTLTLARVLNPLSDVGTEVDQDLAAATARVQERWREQVGQLAQRAGIEATIEIPLQQRGEDTHKTVVRVAREMGASLVAMHSRGANSAVRHVILGSVALGVASDLHVPVLITGREVREPRRSEAPYRLLIATDTSHEAEHMMEQVTPLVAASPAVEVTLYCVDQGKKTADRAAELQTRMEQIRATLGEGSDAEIVIEQSQNPSSVDEAILAAAEARGADAIAMATHGQRSIRHLFQGSVALDVISKSPIPVLLTTVD